MVLVILSCEFHLRYFKPEENFQFQLSHNIKIILFQESTVVFFCFFQKEYLNYFGMLVCYLFGIILIFY